MQEQLTKRALFRGRFIQTEVIRPPGSGQDFVSQCDQCGDCAPACPTNVIGADKAGFPIVDLSKGTCLFCGECSVSCQSGAIKPAKKWDLRAKVTASCLSYNGVMCRVCEDHCDEQAIRFQLMQGGRSVPVFALDACTGCGACAAPCPTKSIQFYQHKQPYEEKPC